MYNLDIRQIMNTFLVLDENNNDILGILELNIKKPIIKQLKKIFTYEKINGKKLGSGLLDKDTICKLCLWEGFSIDFIELLDYDIHNKDKNFFNIYQISIYGDNGVKILNIIDINHYKKLN